MLNDLCIVCAERGYRYGMRDVDGRSVHTIHRRMQEIFGSSGRWTLGVDMRFGMLMRKGGCY